MASENVPPEDADAMRIGANNLTSTLYNTVLAVFSGNSSIDDYEARQNKGQSNATEAVIDCSSACGMLEKKILEGHVIQSEACKHCFLPLLAKDGVVACALPNCRGALEPPLTVPSSTSSVSIDEVDRQMMDYNNQRSKVTGVITSKIIEGYVLQEKSCGLCGMPLMKSQEGFISCVLCPCPAKDPPVMQDEVKEKEVNETEDEKKKTSAEVLVSKLRNVGAKGDELTLVEQEMMDLMIRLGEEGKDTRALTEALKEFFTKEKEKRARSGAAAKKKQETTSPELAVVADANPLDAAPDGTVTRACDPETPRYAVSQASCTFSRLMKLLFESSLLSPEEDFDAQEVQTFESGTDAHQRLTALVEEGWILSPDNDNCKSCDRPVFTHGQEKRCISCVDSTADMIDGKDRDHPPPISSAYNDYAKMMASRLMEGWLIVEGKNCSCCMMPVLAHPKTKLQHCLTHGLVDYKSGLPLSMGLCVSSEMES